MYINVPLALVERPVAANKSTGSSWNDQPARTSATMGSLTLPIDHAKRALRNISTSLEVCSVKRPQISRNRSKQASKQIIDICKQCLLTITCCKLDIVGQCSVLRSASDDRCRLFTILPFKRRQVNDFWQLQQIPVISSNMYATLTKLVLPAPSVHLAGQKGVEAEGEDNAAGMVLLGIPGASGFEH
eukprot:scaffold74073_cov53-Prasinocladus_malaysianus.AAC.3